MGNKPLSHCLFITFKRASICNIYVYSLIFSSTREAGDGWMDVVVHKEILDFQLFLLKFLKNYLMRNQRFMGLFGADVHFTKEYFLSLKH